MQTTRRYSIGNRLQCKIRSMWNMHLVYTVYCLCNVRIFDSRSTKRMAQVRRHRLTGKVMPHAHMHPQSSAGWALHCQSTELKLMLAALTSTVDKEARRPVQELRGRKRKEEGAKIEGRSIHFWNWRTARRSTGSVIYACIQCKLGMSALLTVHGELVAQSQKPTLWLALQGLD